MTRQHVVLPAKSPNRNTSCPFPVLLPARRLFGLVLVLSPELLRPLSVLQQTTTYLVKNVFATACEDSNEGKGAKSGSVGGVSSITRAYVFVEDRLRAVRQDLTVQGLGVATEAAEVLKLVANFYVVAGYLLSDQVGVLIHRKAMLHPS